MTEFPALTEKIVRLEAALSEVAARSNALESELSGHTSRWQLVLERDVEGGRVDVGRWALPSDGDFEWEGEGLRLSLRKTRG